MDNRIWSSGASGTPPTAPASPSTGYPTAGDPVLGIPPTKGGAFWFHQIGESLRALIVQANRTPSHTNLTLLRDSILDLIEAGQNRPFRNAVVNGDMSIAQRNGTTLVTTGLAADTYVIDRHIVRATGAAVTAGQSTDATGCPTGFGTNLKISGAAGNTNVTHKHRIEAAQARRLAGKRVAVSFSMYQDSGAAMAGATVKAFCPTTTADVFSALTQEGATQTLSIANAGTITKYTAFITLGAANVARGLEIDIDLNAALLAGKTCYITGIQVEAVASTATAGTEFEFRDDQLQRSQWFARRLMAGASFGRMGTGVWQTATLFNGVVPCPQMRATPSAAQIGNLVIVTGATNIPVTAVSIVNQTGSAIGVDFGVAGGGTAEHSGDVCGNNDATAGIWLNAEL